MLPFSYTTTSHGFPSSCLPFFMSSKTSSISTQTTCIVSGTLKIMKMDQSKTQLIKSHGPPRWFSPLDSAPASRSIHSPPLLIFLPGIDGSGLGLMLHHKTLGEVFDIWCLHIPLTDRTTFKDMVTLIQSTILSELKRTGHRPIYLVGESIGASLVLAVAIQNPELDLILILANPTMYFGKSLLQSVEPMSEMVNEHLDQLDLMPDTFLWKLNMLYEMHNYLNSNLHDVKAQTLILKSGKDMLLTSIIEDETLGRVIPNCEIKSFVNNAHPLLLDDSFNLLTIIKTFRYYRRGARLDYITDFLPSSPSECKKMFEPYRWMDLALDPVMLSTLDSGKIVRGLGGIPSEGPMILVGNHMMLGLDAIILVIRFSTERSIFLRGMAHPVHFKRFSGGKVTHFPPLNMGMFGAVPNSAKNLYRLLSLKSNVLLYPGGAREALRRKGEEHKLIWPDEPEFVRMAAKFGAKIIPFACVGEDDACQLLLDFDDQMKIPPLKAFIEGLNSTVGSLRTDVKGDIGDQIIHYPIVVPKLPGRYYYLFGKPITTEGKREILSSKDKAYELYSNVQTEVQKSIAYLKKKKANDPYRNILPRLLYQGYYGFDSQVPTFEI